MSKVRIGVQTSISGGIQNAVVEQIEKNGNCGQIFSHSPQSWDNPSPSSDEITKFKTLCRNKDVRPWVIHSSYLVNLCTPKDDLGTKSQESMQQEVNIASELNIPYVNTHLGAHTGAGKEKGLQNAAERIDSINIPDGVKIVVESDAGGGTKLGHKIEHLSKIQKMTDTNLKFCIDTAHTWAAGYRIDTRIGVESTLDEFDRQVGLEDLALIHLNDSKHGVGTNRDEHQHLGDGKIGYEGIRSVVREAHKMDIPMIAETPITDDKGDEQNIQLVKDIVSNEL